VVTKGKPAPNSSLTSDDGKEVGLSGFRGKPVVLFYPKDDTPATICSTAF
jgi:peroxiredoxin